MRGLRSQIFRQSAQIISVHTDVWMLIFGHSGGIICKQGVRHELCGVAYTANRHKVCVRLCAGLFIINFGLVLVIMTNKICIHNDLIFGFERNVYFRQIAAEDYCFAIGFYITENQYWILLSLSFG